MDLEGPDGDEGDGYTVPIVEFSDAEIDCGPDIRFTESLRSAIYVSPAFLADPREVEELGFIYGAKIGMTSLGEGDLIYLEMEDIDTVECGDVFALVRRDEKVKHPDLRRLKYGAMFHILAEVRVLHKEGDIATAVIRTMYSHARRGDVVSTLVPVAAEMPVREPRGDLEGTIVARSGKGLYDLAGPGEVVFLDRGKEDGLRIGNTFYIIKRQDELYGMRENEDPDLPASVVGRLVVTRVEDYSATAVVVNASAPVRVGDDLAQSLE